MITINRFISFRIQPTNFVGCAEQREAHRSRLMRRPLVGASYVEGGLTQPFITVAEHTGLPGASVPLSQTIADCEAFISGEFDHLSEADCYMRGAMTQ